MQDVILFVVTSVRQIFASTELLWSTQRVFFFASLAFFLCLALFAGAHLIQPLHRNGGGLVWTENIEKGWKNNRNKQIRKSRKDGKKKGLVFGSWQCCRRGLYSMAPRGQIAASSFVLVTDSNTDVSTNASKRLVKRLERKQRSPPLS